MLSDIRQALRQSPLMYGALFALLPLLLGLAVVPVVGFGPCGPNVGPSVRFFVVISGAIAMAAPFIGSWLFLVSFRRRHIISAMVGLPLLCGSVFVCLYWFFILVSAVMS